MASYLQIKSLSKSYGPKILFQNIGFNINEGDKIALIAPNGTGKTSLMKILAGKDSSDSGGKIMFLRDIRIAFLEQEYDFEPDKTIFEQIMDSSREFTAHLDQDHLWDYERRVEKFLTGFALNDSSRRMRELSGGEVKRVALSQMLASEADFYIMDEPTNHLDIDAIEFLESHLGRSRCTLFMVTHDRYFLDRVCNTVMEMDRGGIYVYKGNYQNFLEKREERISNYNAETAAVRNILRREFEWIRATPCARTGKAKYRINAFHELKERAEQVYRTQKLDLSDMRGGGSGFGGSRGSDSGHLGTKIIDCKDLSFYYGDKCLLDHFTYNFQRYEKLGIVGANGAGKTTFINLLTGGLGSEAVGGAGGEAGSGGVYGSAVGGGTQPRMTGIIERGESVRIGYFRQEGMSFDEDQTVLETVNDTHLLGRFLFPHDMYKSKVRVLSGGEKRRLYLLTILRQQPNMLILDEPTNDLDIVTLNVLEEYLKEWGGTLIIVSHDRHFLDRLVDHLFVFCGDGVVKDFIGNYSEYRSFIKDYQKGLVTATSSVQKSGGSASGKASSGSKSGPEAKPSPVGADGRASSKPRKLTWKEQRELEVLETELAELSREKESLEQALSSGTLAMDELQKASVRFGEVRDLLDQKELRWLELSVD